jgi:uncharacterized protein
MHENPTAPLSVPAYSPLVAETTRSEDLHLWADRRLVMRPSPIHGIGTFATEPIAAGEVLTRVTGGLIVSSSDRVTGMSDLATELYAEDQIGPDLFRVWPKFIDYHFNHSCDACVEERADDGTQVAMRDIAGGEEMTIDYLFHEGGRWPDHACRCGSDSCRNPEGART